MADAGPTVHASDTIQLGTALSQLPVLCELILQLPGGSNAHLLALAPY